MGRSDLRVRGKEGADPAVCQFQRAFPVFIPVVPAACGNKVVQNAACIGPAFLRLQNGDTVFRRIDRLQGKLLVPAGSDHVDHQRRIRDVQHFPAVRKGLLHGAQRLVADVSIFIGIKVDYGNLIFPDPIRENKGEFPEIPEDLLRIRVFFIVSFAVFVIFLRAFAGAGSLSALPVRLGGILTGQQYQFSLRSVAGLRDHAPERCILKLFLQTASGDILPGVFPVLHAGHRDQVSCADLGDDRADFPLPVKEERDRLCSLAAGKDERHGFSLTVQGKAEVQSFFPGKGDGDLSGGFDLFAVFGKGQAIGKGFGQFPVAFVRHAADSGHSAFVGFRLIILFQPGHRHRGIPGKRGRIFQHGSHFHLARRCGKDRDLLFCLGLCLRFFLSLCFGLFLRLRHRSSFRLLRLGFIFEDIRFGSRLRLGLRLRGLGLCLGGSLCRRFRRGLSRRFCGRFCRGLGRRLCGRFRRRFGRRLSGRFRWGLGLRLFVFRGRAGQLFRYRCLFLRPCGNNASLSENKGCAEQPRDKSVHSFLHRVLSPFIPRQNKGGHNQTKSHTNYTLFEMGCKQSFFLRNSRIIKAFFAPDEGDHRNDQNAALREGHRQPDPVAADDQRQGKYRSQLEDKDAEAGQYPRRQAVIERGEQVCPEDVDAREEVAERIHPQRLRRD